MTDDPFDGWTEAEMLEALKNWATEDERDLIHLALPRFKMFQLLALVQLALRHPNVPLSNREFALDWCHHLINHIAPDDGPLRALCLAGFNPDSDVKADDTVGGVTDDADR